MGRAVDTLRAAANTVFFPSWTAFMVSYAVTAAALTRDKRIFSRLQRNWARGLFRFWGVELEAVGTEHMRADARYVVVSNHLSHIDTVALFVALPQIPGFLAKRELWRIPFLGQALRSGGHIMVDRDDRRGLRRWIAGAAEQIRAGATVLIFPEGTRGESNTVGKFKIGAFHLARATGVPILPVGIEGSRSVLPKHGRLVHGRKIRVRIGEPIDVGKVTGGQLKALTERTRAAIAELCEMPLR